MRPISRLLLIGLSLSISLFHSSKTFAQADTAVTPPDVTAPVAPDSDQVEEPRKPVKILGWKEWVWVIKPELIMRAKLDTGARTSSVHAKNIEQIEIDGKKWIKFTILNHNDEKSVRLRHKAPLVRVSKVKNDSGGLDERYVVLLVFQVGDQKLEGEFNLNDREQMTCSMLIGRNLLMQLGMVDSARTDLLKKPRHPKTIEKKSATK